MFGCGRVGTWDKSTKPALLPFCPFGKGNGEKEQRIKDTVPLFDAARNMISIRTFFIRPITMLVPSCLFSFWSFAFVNLRDCHPNSSKCAKVRVSEIF